MAGALETAARYVTVIETTFRDAVRAKENVKLLLMLLLLSLLILPICFDDHFQSKNPNQELICLAAGHRFKAYYKAACLARFNLESRTVDVEGCVNMKKMAVIYY